MEKNFNKNREIFIGLSRNDDKITINIVGEYSRSQHKGQLYINSDKFGDEVLTLWKSIGTKKLLSVKVNFEHIDWYDSDIDMYEVPSFHIERGLRKTRVSTREHGSIPKDWEISLSFLLEDTKTITPIIEVIGETLGSLLTEKHNIALTKEIRLFMKGETNTSYTIEK